MLAYTCMATAALVVAGCGGDPGGAAAGAGAVSTTLSGSVVKGPVGSATVTAKKADGTACGSTTTNTAGAYTLSTTCTGDLIIEATGGTYLDEATNASKTLSSPMKVVITAAGGSVTGVVTPLTSMAYSIAFGTDSAASKTAFDTQMSKTAAQFGLPGVNLSTTLPIVTEGSNAYGNALKAISQYLKDNNGTTLATFTAPTFTTQSALDAFAASYNTAFRVINGVASSVTFNLNGFTITGTGAGGGSGTCGITAAGNVSAGGFTVPVSFSYCVTGILGGSCDASNTTLNQSVAGQGGLAGAVNLSYTYSAVCPAGAIQINLK